jgi:hypothetical protein
VNQIHGRVRSERTEAKMDGISDQLQRASKLFCKEMELSKPDTCEYAALLNQIRALSDKHRALIDIPK